MSEIWVAGRSLLCDRYGAQWRAAYFLFSKLVATIAIYSNSVALAKAEPLCLISRGSILEQKKMFPVVGEGTRRSFISFCTCFLSALPLGLSAQATSNPVSDFLYAFADTLLPVSETGSAAEKGSHHRILLRASNDAVFADILNRATSVLNESCRELYGTEFANLPAAKRNEVFGHLDTLPENDLLGWFFRAARAEIFLHYYSQEGAGRSVGLASPPQPAGFENIDRAWRN